MPNEASSTKMDQHTDLLRLRMRVENYFRLVQSLGARCARRKARVTVDDLHIWDFVVSQQRLAQVKAPTIAQGEPSVDQVK